MFADRSYSSGLFAPTDRRASLIYFAAAVPTVGFVHGAAGARGPLHNARAANRYGRCWAMPNHVAAVLKAVASGYAMACLMRWDLVVALANVVIALGRAGRTPRV